MQNFAMVSRAVSEETASLQQLSNIKNFYSRLHVAANMTSQVSIDLTCQFHILFFIIIYFHALTKTRLTPILIGPPVGGLC